MREVRLELDAAKQRIKKLQNMPLRIRINKGRNKFITFDGEIKEVYPFVFVIESYEDKKQYSHNYTDVLTHSVLFGPLKKNSNN